MCMSSYINWCAVLRVLQVFVVARFSPANCAKRACARGTDELVNVVAVARLRLVIHIIIRSHTYTIVCHEYYNRLLRPCDVDKRHAASSTYLYAYYLHHDVASISAVYVYDILPQVYILRVKYIKNT